MTKDFSSLHGRKISVLVEKWLDSENHDKTPPDAVIRESQWVTPENEAITDPDAIVELERRLAAKELELHGEQRGNGAGQH